MKCKNCESEVVRVSKEFIYCEECNEIFKVSGDKFTPVKDKEKFFKEAQEKMKVSAAKIKDIANKTGFTVDNDDDEDGLLDMFI